MKSYKNIGNATISLLPNSPKKSIFSAPVFAIGKTKDFPPLSLLSSSSPTFSTVPSTIWWDVPNLRGMFPPSNMSGFCERIELLLKKHNLTFYKFSKSCRIDFNAYCKWKKNSIPTVFSLIAIAEYFNVSLDYLVGRSDSI